MIDGGTVFALHTICLLLLNVSSLTEQDPYHQIDGFEARVAVLLSPGDDIRILSALSSAWLRGPDQPFPLVVAIEPGPIDLAQGLRILPNEVLPRLSLPRLLILGTSDGAIWNDLLLAHLRRCLLAGTEIWLVGDRFPEELAALPLDPGQQIRRVSLEDLEARLRERVSGEEKMEEHRWWVRIICGLWLEYERNLH